MKMSCRCEDLFIYLFIIYVSSLFLDQAWALFTREQPLETLDFFFFSVYCVKNEQVYMETL